MPLTQMTNRRQQQGIALITAVFIVSIIAAIATSISFSQQVWLRQTQNIRDYSQSNNSRHSAINYMITVLTKDAQDNNIDELSESWSSGSVADYFAGGIPFAGGAVAGKIIDAQSKFNLNNLIKSGKISQADLGVFRNILIAQDLEPNLANAVIDWIDDNDTALADGAEDVDYMSMIPPYRAANQFMQSIYELKLIKGFNDDVIKSIIDHVTVLPGRTSININTASAVVISALFTNMSVSEAQTIVDERDGKSTTTDQATEQANNLLTKSQNKPFKKNEFKAPRIPANFTLLPKLMEPGDYDVKTKYFEAVLTTSYGRIQRQSKVLIRRFDKGTNPAKLVWKGQLLVIPELAMLDYDK